MKYDVDYFIKKFEAIPENQWCAYERENNNGQRCAHGHCYSHDVNPEYAKKSLEEHFLFELAKNNLDVIGTTGFGYINNGDNSHYQQSTPKQRVLAALYDIKAKQQPEVKERTVYVVVSPEIKEQVKELIYN